MIITQVGHVFVGDEIVFHFDIRKEMTVEYLVCKVCEELDLFDISYFWIYRKHNDHRQWLGKREKLLNPKYQQTKNDVSFYFGIRFFPESILHVKNASLLWIMYKLILCEVQSGDYKLDSKLSRDIFERLIALVIHIEKDGYKSPEESVNYFFSDPFAIRCMVENLNLLSCRESSDYTINHLIKAHKYLKLWTKGKAVISFLQLLEQCPYYGMHRYHVQDQCGRLVMLGVSQKGFTIFHKTNVVKHRFEWRQIENLYFKNKQFTIEVCHSPDASVRTRKLYTWLSQSSSYSQAIWLMSVSQHQYYLHNKLTNSNSYLSKSKYVDEQIIQNFDDYLNIGSSEINLKTNSGRSKLVRSSTNKLNCSRCRSFVEKPRNSSSTHLKMALKAKRYLLKRCLMTRQNQLEELEVVEQRLVDIKKTGKDSGKSGLTVNLPNTIHIKNYILVKCEINVNHAIMKSSKKILSLLDLGDELMKLVFQIYLRALEQYNKLRRKLEDPYVSIGPDENQLSKSLKHSMTLPASDKFFDTSSTNSSDKENAQTSMTKFRRCRSHKLSNELSLSRSYMFSSMSGTSPQSKEYAIINKRLMIKSDTKCSNHHVNSDIISNDISPILIKSATSLHDSDNASSEHNGISTTLV
ncbi:hypothetical protein GJ496_010016 [Pomphorhynchus laevis]|nr:hypothetical protein GJ496_010016 [Pomphorhynchus laevis]